MKPKLTSLFLASVFVAFWNGGRLEAAPQQDLVSAVKKATAGLVAADKVVVGARNALLRAKSNLDTTRFNSPAYNARITTQQEKAAKEKYAKIDPKKKVEKENALELYQLTQELAAQRKTALQAAEKVLPQREAQAKTAETKYATALAAAEKLAGPIKSLVRKTESEALAKLKASKQATEKAAFSKATAEQKAAANAQILKTMATLVAADKALQQAAATVKKASDKDRPQKLAATEKATKAYVTALHATVQFLPPFKVDKAKAGFLQRHVQLVEADKAVQKSSAALKQARQNIQNRINAVKRAETRVRAGLEGVKKRIAKIRARKDLAREQAAVKRAEAAKLTAEKALPPITATAAKMQKEYTAALQAAVKMLLSPEAEKSLAAEKVVIAKAMTDKQAGIKKENESLARVAVSAKVAADKARAAVVVANKLVAQRVAVRGVLKRTQQRRFYRAVSAAHSELSKHKAALALAVRRRQPKIAVLNRVTTALKRAKDNATKAQKNAAAQIALVTSATKAKDAAEKLAQVKATAKTAAEKKAKDAQVAASAAQKVVKTSSAPKKKAAEKQAQVKGAEAQAAAKKVKAAQQAAKVAQTALKKAQAVLKAAQKRATDTAKTAKAAAQKATAAQATFVKATAEKNSAEKIVNQRRKDIEVASNKVTIAKAAAYGGLKTLPVSTWNYATARHLMVRAGFGGTPDEVARLHAMGLYRAVSHLVNFKNQAPADIAFVAYPKERPENYETSLNGTERRLLRIQRVNKDRQQIQNMRVWWLRRMIESPRPLEEKLTFFWHGQLPAQYNDVGDSYYMYQQNELFRNNAAGNFATLLHGICHDAAMLKYLNNDTNVKGRANENLAREIMELFSMGRDQGYNEIDIRQGARALTGYTYDSWTGQFRFISQRHDTEPKTIFGKKGNWNGDDFTRLILETPHPAKFIARQMFIFFAHDNPSTDTIESLANVLRLNNYELAPMLENLFLSEEFYSARAMSTQIKGPIQLVVGLHRDLGLKNADYAYLVSAVRGMGQDLFEPPSVFGWQAGRSWVSTSRTFARYNALAEILERRPRGGKVGVDVVGTLLAGKNFQNHAEVVDYLVKCSWNVPLSESKRQAMIQFLKPLPPPTQWGAKPGPVNVRLTRLLVMLICSPEYQLS